MKLWRIFRLLSALAGIAFLAGSAYAAYLIWTQQAKIHASPDAELTRLVGQVAMESGQLVQSFGVFGISYGSTGATDGLEPVKTRITTLKALATQLKAPVFSGFTSASPDRTETLAALETAMETLSKRLTNLRDKMLVPEMLDLLGSVDRRVLALASAANSYASAKVMADERALVDLNWLFAALVVGLVVSVLLYIGALSGEFRRLSRDNAKLQVVAVSLEHTKTELENANKGIQTANAELNLHNQILKMHDNEMRTQNLRFDAALNNMSQGLCMVGTDGKLIVCNNQFRQLFGIDPETARPGTAMAAIMVRMGVSLKFNETQTIEMMRSQDAMISAGRPEAFTRDCPDGRSFAVHHQPMLDGGWVATYEDITERRKAEEKIFHMAHHDALTGLPNRVYFMQHLEEALTKVRRGEASCAVLCLDLDRFKAVNDTLGHPVGDLLLKEVASRLKAAVKPGDVVARFGGDEFAILKNSDVDQASLAHLGQSLVRSISSPFHLEGNEVSVGTSVGIGIGFQDGASSEQLLKNSDLALYHSKSEGRGAYHFFEAHMDAKAQARRLVETDLKRAIPAGELDLYYQPLVNVASRRITGFESLIRWRHAEKGMISPAEFIPIAEEVGLIIQIGEWALRRACNTAPSWPEDIKVSVNLSPVQFRDKNLVQVVKSALTMSGLAPNRLDLEITETALVQDIDFTVKVLHELREMGVHVSLDDFGTGYSSLSYLRSFPFDKIKIDQSFVRDLSTRPDCLAIVKSVTTLGENLGMSTLAEGVETEENLTILRELGCQEAQGYLFSRPVPNPEALQLIQKFNMPAPSIIAA